MPSLKDSNKNHGEERMNEKSDRNGNAITEWDEKSFEKFISEAATAPADSGNPMELPSWFQLNKFKQGQEFFKKNIFSFLLGKLAGLIAVLAIPSILKVLIFTKQSGSPCSAFKRYASTLIHMCEWYNGDLLEPSSNAYKSLNIVRNKHGVVAKRACKANIGQMSQLDMILTQFGFMGFILLSYDKLGSTKPKSEEMDGFLHYWRTIGYLIGIEDRFNLCSGTEDECRALCLSIREKIFKQSMNKVPENFDIMAKSLVSGMRCTIPSLDYDSFIKFIKVDLLGLNDKTKLSCYSKFTLIQMRFVTGTLLQIKSLAFIFRPLLNANMRLAIYLTNKFPFLAYFRFGKNLNHE